MIKTEKELEALAIQGINLNDEGISSVVALTSTPRKDSLLFGGNNDNEIKYTPIYLPNITSYTDNISSSGLGIEIFLPSCTSVSVSTILGTVHLYPCLTRISESAGNALMNSHCIVFHHTADDPVLFSMTSWPKQETNTKAILSISYTIYTDNPTIRSGCLAKANDKTTITVKHIDGSDWES